MIGSTWWPKLRGRPVDRDGHEFLSLIERERIWVYVADGRNGCYTTIINNNPQRAILVGRRVANRK